MVGSWSAHHGWLVGQSETFAQTCYLSNQPFLPTCPKKESSSCQACQHGLKRPYLVART